MFSIMHAKRRELMSVEDFFRFFDLCLLLSLKQFNERTTSDGQRTKCQKSMCNPGDTQIKERITLFENDQILFLERL